MEDIEKVVKKYGTPLYYYEIEKAEKNVKLLREVLPPTIKIYLSIKANPCKKIICELGKSVDGVEVASAGELDIAIKSGICNQNILFIGPGKSYSELDIAVEKKIKLIVVESIEEINRINKICITKNLTMNIAIRINPNIKSSSRLKMGGVPSQFGIDEENVLEVIKALSQYEKLHLKGVHFYFGSQILDSNQIVKNIEYIFATCKRIQRQTNISLDFIDLGGGIGVPYFIHDNELDLNLLKSKLRQLFFENVNDFQNTEFIWESGRFILAECGYYIVKIEYIKESRGKKFVIVNGGLNHHSTAIGVGAILRGNFNIYCLNKKEMNDTQEKVTIVGPLCTPIDVLARDITLPTLEVGDILVVPKSGAYGLSASPVNFLCHNSPREVINYRGKIYLIS